jgi:hypothetical protein
VVVGLDVQASTVLLAVCSGADREFLLDLFEVSYVDSFNVPFAAGSGAPLFRVRADVTVY